MHLEKPRLCKNGEPQKGGNCPKCGYWFGDKANNRKIHISACDGVYVKKKKYPPNYMADKRKKQIKVMKKAVMCDDWYDYDKMCSENNMKSDYLRRDVQKQAGVYELFLSREVDMKSFKYWMTTNCGYCGKEIKIRKKHFANRQYIHCDNVCHEKNRVKISEDIQKKKWEELYGEIGTWEKWKHHKITNLKEYRRLNDRWMRHNLKKYKPNEWNYYKHTDNTSIDHKYLPVIKGFKRMTPPWILSHSDNLQVLTRSENSEKSDNLIYPIEEWPDFLVEAYNKPIVLSRVNGIGRPPKRVSALEQRLSTYHKNKCNQCDKEYYIEMSKADDNENICGIPCENKVRYNELIDNGIIYQMLDERIPKLNYNNYTQLDTEIANQLEIPKPYVTRVRIDGFKLPNGSRLNLERERQLVKLAHNYKFPDSYWGPYELKCIKCGVIIKISGNKQRILRKLNLDTYEKIPKDNVGKCRKCMRWVGGWTARNLKKQLNFSA